ncbi:DMT family transporter [Palleronia sediminis]|uniref:DMT family transporter n=1 Tax=Palleronia sediminis TaxID=2547833 RepID=A0A4R6AHI2_9RHOB|nr:DMT family transporter [Palleronia sediminis]TDL83661.1 DMT family transporter [Palleronia sediminis]
MTGPETPAAEIRGVQPVTDRAQILKATVWMLGAVVSFTSMAVAGRAVTLELDTFELMLYRSLIGICLVVAGGAVAGRLGQIRARRLGLHLIRNLSHFAGQNLWFLAISLIPLAQVFAIEFTSPIWVALAAPLLLAERLTRLKITVAIVGFVGVLIVARPGLDGLDPGQAAAAAAAIGFAGSAIFTKLLTRTESILSILFWLTVMQAGMGLVAAGFDGDIAWPSASIWPWLALIGAAGLTAHMCLTTALSLAPATIVMPVDFLRLPVAALVGALFFAEALDPVTALGGAIILAANWVNIRAQTRRPKA